MGIKYYIILALLIPFLAWPHTVKNDSLSLDSKWNKWQIESVTPDGNWLLAYQMYVNDMKNTKLWIINTNSKNKIDISGGWNVVFTKNNFAFYTSNKETIELDLITKIKNSLGKLQQSNWLDKLQLFCSIDEKNKLIVKRYSKDKSHILLDINDVKKYYLSPQQNKLFYQKRGTDLLYCLDLKTLKEKDIQHFNQEITELFWNDNESRVAIRSGNDNLYYIDLSKGNVDKILIPQTDFKIWDFEVSFFPDNNISLKYKILNAPPSKTDKYLDIWNGNDRNLRDKGSSTTVGELIAFVYRASENRLVELPCSNKQDYYFLGVSNFLLVFDPFEFQDYSFIYEKIRYRLLNLADMSEDELTIARSLTHMLNRAPNNEFIMYPKDDEWELYELNTLKRFRIPHTDLDRAPLWSLDSKKIYYTQGSNLYSLDVKTKKTHKLTHNKEGDVLTIQNMIQIKNGFYFDSKKPLIFTLRTSRDYLNSIHSLFNGKITKIVDQTPNQFNLDRIYNGVSEDAKILIWTEENYNVPQSIKVYTKGHVSTLVESDIPKELYNWCSQKILSYKDKYGKELQGVLWYPKDFDPTKTYPMVTHIYDLGITYSRSYFEMSTLFNRAGFNRFVLNELGYFVFEAETYVSDEGPGVSAVECLTQAINKVLSTEKAINPSKIGLIGISFAGYKTSFVMGNSNLFATGVSGSGAHDLIRFNYHYNYTRQMPNWFLLETGQYGMKESFGDNPEKYYRNSSIHFAQNYQGSLLMATGLHDTNVPWINSQDMYIALKHYQKPVIALFYKDEGHSWMYHQNDYSRRVLDWFDYYLKGNTKIKWISDGVDYSKY